MVSLRPRPKDDRRPQHRRRDAAGQGGVVRAMDGQSEQVAGRPGESAGWDRQGGGVRRGRRFRRGRGSIPGRPPPRSADVPSRRRPETSPGDRSTGGRRRSAATTTIRAEQRTKPKPGRRGTRERPGSPGESEPTGSTRGDFGGSRVGRSWLARLDLEGRSSLVGDIWRPLDPPIGTGRSSIAPPGPKWTHANKSANGVPILRDHHRRDQGIDRKLTTPY